LTFKNQWHDKEEQHDTEVTVVRREVDVHRSEEIGLHILAKPMNEGMVTSCEGMTYTCMHLTFDYHESFLNV